MLEYWFVARRRRRIEAVAERIRESGGSAHPYVLDVADPQAVSKAVADLAAEHGNIDILVNNAGIADPRPFNTLEDEDWRRILDINLDAVFHMSRRVSDHMIEREISGIIINIASVLGFAAQPTQAAYATSKAGVIQLTRAMALDLVRYGIRVNALAPGYILTDINEAFFKTPAGDTLVKRIPMRRVGTTAELDGALLFLASQASSYMCGSVLTVDGGIRARL